MFGVEDVGVDAVVVVAVKAESSAASAWGSASASVSASAADDEAVFAVGPEAWEPGEGAESVVVEAEELSPLAAKQRVAVLLRGCRV